MTELLTLDDDGFRARFRGTPIKRAKRRGLARNAAIALGNSRAGRADLQNAAERDPDPIVREAASWAAAQQVVGDDRA